MRLSQRSTWWIVGRLSFLEKEVIKFCPLNFERNPYLLHPVPWISSWNIFPEAKRRSSLWILEATVEGFAAALREQNIIQRHKASFSSMLDGLKREFHPCRSFTRLCNTHWKKGQMDKLWRCGHVYLHLKFWSVLSFLQQVSDWPEEGSMNRNDHHCHWSPGLVCVHHAGYKYTTGYKYLS